MNKGLEVIEASYLFKIPINKIDVLIHPQSIIHSMVEFIDGSFLSQLGYPDMKIPISYALGFPERIKSGAKSINFADTTFTFFKPDVKKFPCLNLAYFALSQGHNFCVALNAANEIAVDSFLKEQIKFQDIFRINSEIINSIKNINLTSLNDISEYDAEIKSRSKALIKKFQ